MLAIIETGGKQYLVSPKTKIRVEKLETETGKDVVFDKVLLVSDETSTNIGKPYVTGAKVTAKVIVAKGRADKIRIFKYKSKVRYRRRKGHRQEYTELEIQNIQ